MSESKDDVRYDIATTRQRMSETLAELDANLTERRDAVAARVDAVRATLDPARITALVERHPWAAVAVALGLGVYLGRSGADRAIASSAARAAETGAQAAVGAAQAAREAVAERLPGGQSARREYLEMQVPLESGYLADESPEDESGLVDHLVSHVGRALRFEELERDMREAFTTTKLPTSI